MVTDLMQVIAPPQPIVELLKRYEELRGVLDFVFVEAAAGSVQSAEIHQRAALLALGQVQRRTDQWAETIDLEDDIPREKLFRERIPAGFMPNGRRISVRDFVGPFYKNCIQLDESYADGTTGLAYAFMNPPYELGGDPAALFLEFKTRVFDGFPDGAEIWAWQTDSLNYFDAGREWWGTFFWTYRATPSSMIIAILGSTTD
jgi:hypothetical protein